MVEVKRALLLLCLGTTLLGATRTIAGDGIAGTNDGPGATARFLVPFGIAFDPASQATYVADATAQTIRRIDPAGNVTTFAGAATLEASGLGSAGGYADGRAAVAQFNRPTGIAVAGDGSVFVADSFNHCIRKITAGIVSTFAGNAQRSAGNDGIATDASFDEPRGIAIDASGTMFVADFGNGVREIDPAGNVTTIVRDSKVLALAIAGSGRDETLFYTSNRAFENRTFLPGHVKRVRLADGATTELRAPEISGDIDIFEGVIALDVNNVILTNAARAAIYAASFDCSSPERTCGRIISGSTGLDVYQLSGFADGSTKDARYYLPIGLAKKSDSVVLVADFGNRRIRELTLDEAVPTPDVNPVVVISGPSLDAFDTPATSLPALIATATQSAGRRVVVRQETLQPRELTAARVKEIVERDKPRAVIFCVDRQLLFGEDIHPIGTADPALAPLYLLPKSIPSTIVTLPLALELGVSIFSSDFVPSTRTRISAYAMDVSLDREIAMHTHGRAIPLLSAFIARVSDGKDALFEANGMLLSRAGREFLATALVPRMK